MGNKLYQESSIKAIADAIRAKNGTSDTYKVAEMGDAVRAIQGGGMEAPVYSWNPNPEPVQRFLDEVTYDPNDYTVSCIADYVDGSIGAYTVGASVETVAGTLQRNSYDIPVTVGVTNLYNDIPNLYTEYTVEKSGKVVQAGTLHPCGTTLRRIFSSTTNVRDLGGWACDGGTVKYGMLYRGGEIEETDIDLFLHQLGVRQELNLRGREESENKTASILGGQVGYVCTESYTWYSLENTADWTTILRCIFGSIAQNKPVYFHCAAGADRTGTVACILEALLGVGRSDIDKDYELTSFWTGVHTDTAARMRNEAEWQGLINQIMAVPNGETMRDKAANWVASLGFTAAEINQFRRYMIDGTPDDLNVSIGSAAVTNVLTNAGTNNDATNVTKYQPYTATVAADDGYAIESVAILMDGKDITHQVFAGTRTNLYRAIIANLENAKIDNDKKAVIHGQGYVANITADAGYSLDAAKGGSVTLTMGGIDMAVYYADGKIAIPVVTGDIQIIVKAVKSASTKVEVPINWNEGMGCNYNTGDKFGLAKVQDYTCSDVISVTPGATYTVKIVGSTEAGQLRFVGGGANNLVTESTKVDFKAETGEQILTFTPASTTTQMIIRGYTASIGKGTWTLIYDQED